MIIEYWRTVLKRSHVVWAQALQALFGALSFFDPGAALAIWNQMPASVAAHVPQRFVAAVGALFFVWAVISILLRLLRQPKLEAKIEEKRNADG